MTFTVYLSLLAIAFVSSSHGQSWEDSPLITNVTQLTELRALRQRVVDNGCDINLCFAIDASASVNSTEFMQQQNFVDLIINILATEKPKNYCGAQYGSGVGVISTLTSNKDLFAQKVFEARQIGGFSNIAGAIGFTGFQLIPRREDANKIIILGDGFDSIGFAPMVVADQVRSEGIDICAVAIGDADLPALNKITGDPGRVLTLTSFFQLAEIISAVVVEACGLP